MQDHLRELGRYCETIAGHLERALGDSLRDVYKLGSLAHGGFSPVYSDIDVCVLLNCPDAPEQMDRVLTRVSSLHEAIRANRLTVIGAVFQLETGRVEFLS